MSPKDNPPYGRTCEIGPRIAGTVIALPFDENNGTYGCETAAFIRAGCQNGAEDDAITKVFALVAAVATEVLVTGENVGEVSVMIVALSDPPSA